MKKIKSALSFAFESFKFASMIYLICILALKLQSKAHSIQIDKYEIVPLGESYNTVGGFPAIVRIKSQDGKCSGTVIDGNYVLTAAHCVVDENNHMSRETFTISDDNDSEVSKVNSVAVALDLDRDIAILKGDFNRYEKLDVDWEGKYIGTIYNRPMIACGYPAGANLFCSRMMGYSNEYFLITTYGGILQKGMSGGTVLDAGSMVVIGVNSAVSRNGVAIGSVVGADVLFKLRGVE